MSTAKWIWYPGDFEVYHNLKLHLRREEYGFSHPAHWPYSAVYPYLEFSRTFEVPEDTSFVVRAHGKAHIRVDNLPFYPTDAEIPLSAGKHKVTVFVGTDKGLPSIYINSPYLVTDEKFHAHRYDLKDYPAACEPAYTKETDDPEIFPFAYERIDAVSKTACDGGILYDFGKETFAKLELSGLEKSAETSVFYGESREEALADKKKCYLWETVSGKTEASLVPRAFRFVHLRAEDPKDLENVKVHALYEYLPIAEKGSFSCDDPTVRKIWDTCAYTFHLCSREFFIDGIKRDRWVWGGDARQSFMISNYLFADREICKRTITALIPKETPVRHVNTINDYTMYMLISVWEYYHSFGDKAFVEFMWDRIMALYTFLVNRLDENGFVVQRTGDWIFIDWSDIDKDGPLCAEQILLWQTEQTMAKLCELLDKPKEEHMARADALKAKIMQNFWDDGRSAFIDSFTSGKKHISRHANIFAILFDFVDAPTKARILQQVLLNDEITPITTPYFKLYELMALCSMGQLEYAQNMLDSYWGKMLDLGATSIWEEYDPNYGIPECYGMYGGAFQKSLCHAWSCGPIYFLGRYCLGVRAEKPAYEAYTVEPNPGKYKRFSGVVPTEKGNIRVSYENGSVTVLSELDGGTLIWNGKQASIPKGEPVTL